MLLDKPATSIYMAARREAYRNKYMHKLENAVTKMLSWYSFGVEVFV
jgi:hypothetical protein